MDALRPLFDAPSRDPGSDMDWTAHTFLSRLGERNRTAQAILGFSWGFAISAGTITPRGPQALCSEDWDEHGTILARDYPGWSFATGFVSA